MSPRLRAATAHALRRAPADAVAGLGAFMLLGAASFAAVGWLFRGSADVLMLLATGGR